MAISIDSAAQRICEIGNWKITNLALQKTLYLTHMYHLGYHGAPLVNEAFEAWDYGPVLPDLYRRVAMFGAKPIQDIFRLDEDCEGSLELGTINAVAPGLVSRPPAELVSITHWTQGAWAKNYRPNLRGIIISDMDIADEFNRRVGRVRAA